VKRIALDTETTGLDAWHGDEPFCIAGCWEDGSTFCYQWLVDPFTRIVIPDPAEFEEVRKIYEDPNIEKIFHNAKFDIRMIEQAWGWKLAGKLHETMFMAHICNTQEPSFGLKQLSEKYLDYPKTDQEDLKRATIRGRRFGSKAGWLLGTTWTTEPDGNLKAKAAVEADYWIPKTLDPKSTLCEDYCVGDVERTMLLFLLYSEGLDELGLWQVYEDEMALWPVTFAMEARGVRIDVDQVRGEIVAAQDGMRKSMETILKAAWPDFNINSNKDLAELIYGKLKLPVLKRTEKKGAPAVNIDAMIDHQDNPIIHAILSYNAYRNGLANFLHKYVHLAVRDPLLEEECWCLHADFNQVGPVTGRFSCRNPNLQNVANALTTRSPVGIQGRGGFGPRDGYIWLTPDYSQLEVRIFADVSQEPMMLKAIEEGADLHTACTNKAWGGEGNPAAIRAAIHALELDGTGTGDVSEALTAHWSKWGIRSKGDLRKLSAANKTEFASAFMHLFGWDIVKAEKSIGKKTSRAKAKMILFAKLFGGGPNAIKDLLMCSYAEALQFLEDYDIAFPAIVAYIDELSNQARVDGFIINRYGRRIAVKADKAYRSVNYMVQGSAADLLKRSMRNCAAYLRETGVDGHIVMSIHDEIVFEFRRAHATYKHVLAIKRIMEDHGGAFGIETPVEVKKVLYRWDQKTPSTIGALAV